MSRIGRWLTSASLSSCSAWPCFFPRRLDCNDEPSFILAIALAGHRDHRRGRDPRRAVAVAPLRDRSLDARWPCPRRRRARGLGCGRAGDFGGGPRQPGGAQGRLVVRHRRAPLCRCLGASRRQYRQRPRQICAGAESGAARSGAWRPGGDRDPRGKCRAGRNRQGRAGCSDGSPADGRAERLSHGRARFGQRYCHQPRPASRRFRRRGRASAGPDRPRFDPRRGLFRRNQAGSYPRRRQGAYPVDGRRPRPGRACRKHHRRHRRRPEQQHRQPVARGRSDLFLGAAGAAHPGAHPGRSHSRRHPTDRGPHRDGDYSARKDPAAMKRALAALLVGSLLASCKVGPDYHVPEHAMALSPAANRAFLSGHETAFASAPLPDHWWHLYNDARLDAYVQEALAANADLRAADANLRRASEVVREVEAGRTVQTRIQAGAYAARVGGYTLTVPLDVAYSAAIGIAIDYPLDLAGGIKRGIEAAQDNREAIAAARDQVRVTVAAAVTRSYADVCSANVTLAATRHVLDIQNRTLSSVQRLFKGGRGTAFDVTRARTAADQSAAALIEIDAARQASLFELAALMGRASSEYPRELANCASPPMLSHPLPIGDGSALIARRPEIRAAERLLAAATAGIGIQTAQLYPQVALSGSAGLANAISGFFSGASFGALAGPLVSW